MRACHWCGSEQGSAIEGTDEVVELRPYGPDAADVCFDCGTSPEHEAETNVTMLRYINAIVSSGHGIAITSEGIVPL